VAAEVWMMVEGEGNASIKRGSDVRVKYSRPHTPGNSRVQVARR
jgi:hypothetical protein